MSIHCSNCGKENTTENSFCGGCGVSLGAATEAICDRCGAEMPASAVYCGKCGHSLAKLTQQRRATPSRDMPVTSSTADHQAAAASDSFEPVPVASSPTGVDKDHPFRSGSLLREMVTIAPGKFMMGSLAGYGNQDECPRHEVCLSRFRIDRFVVSNIEFERFRPKHAQGRSATSSSDLDPAVFVTYEDCCQYCRWRSEQEGLPPDTYKLPTEAQWEYCARGNEDFLFPWGNEVVQGACNTREAGLGKAVPVDEGLPNGFNLLHMGSNVREWCNDWYNDAYYAMEESSSNDPQGPPAIEIVNMKVVRGASFQDLASELSRCAARNYAHPRTESDDIGFRCVRNA